MSQPRFHLAFPVDDLDTTRAFYQNVLGCKVGRESPQWIDFDFHGHQITAHLAPEACVGPGTSAVDGRKVPVRHFGLILPRELWDMTADRLEAAGTPFLIEPYIRFAGRSGEQGTFFVTDPSGNALEFKTFASDEAIFSQQPIAPQP